MVMEKDFNKIPENGGLNSSQSAMRFYASPEEQELERLKENINRSATEKFHMLMTMMKIGKLMKKAKIHHKV